MTHSKAEIIILSILLMFISNLNAQLELTQTSTEFVTESLLPSAPPSDADSFYTTCEFDLENIESLLPYLPDICTEIYYNRSENNLYLLYLEEAKNFDKFYKKLNDFELREQPNGDKEELTKYPFESKLRYDTYNKVDLPQCLTLANTSVTAYLNCLKGKRLELAELIPGEEEK